MLKELLTSLALSVNPNDLSFAMLQYHDLKSTFTGIDNGLAEEANPLAKALFGNSYRSVRHSWSIIYQGQKKVRS